MREVCGEEHVLQGMTYLSGKSSSALKQAENVMSFLSRRTLTELDEPSWTSLRDAPVDVLQIVRGL